MIMQPPIFNPLPCLCTARLLLRKLDIADANDLYAMLSNPNNCKYIDRLPVKNNGKVMDFIEFRNQGVERNEWGYWGIALRQTNQLVGTLCLWNISENGQEAELGYELHPLFQKKGYMEEAVAQIITFAFNELNFGILKAFTHIDNLASIRLLEKNGFERTGFIKEICTKKDGEMVLGVYTLGQECKRESF